MKTKHAAVNVFLVTVLMLCCISTSFATVWQLKVETNSHWTLINIIDAYVLPPTATLTTSRPMQGIIMTQNVIHIFHKTPYQTSKWTVLEINLDVVGPNLNFGTTKGWDGEVRLTLYKDGVQKAQNTNSLSGNLANVHNWQQWAVSSNLTRLDSITDLSPDNFTLRQNYPNPFNPETTIPYLITTSGHVSLVIYNEIGQKVRTLIDQNQAPGEYTQVWDGKDQNGKLLATGSYFYQLVQDGNILTKSMLFMR